MENVQQLQWVIFHQLQMALWNLKKKAEELQRLANYSQHPKMNELPARWEAGLQTHFGESPASSLFPDALHPNSCGVWYAQPQALGTPCTVISEAVP